MDGKQPVQDMKMNDKSGMGMPPGGMPPMGRGPKGRGPRGGGPGGLPQDPQMREIAIAVMPDFPRWRTAFFKLDCVCAALTFLLSCIFFVYFKTTGVIAGEEGRYFVTHLVVPTILHLLILGGAMTMRKRLPEMDMRQNFIPIFALVLINLVMCLTHSIFIAAMAIYCIPICMTTVFSNKKLCQLITNISIAAVIITVVKEFLIDAGADQRVWIIPQGIVIICILSIMGVVAQTALSMTEGQKQKLFDYALSIKEAQRRAEAANIAKSAFLANMSHEIRTPINAILGMNEMILRENKDEQIAEYAKNVHTAGNSLLYLVNDVLDISKIESGKLEIVETNYDTASFIHDCFNMIAERAEKKGLELKIECSEDLPSQMRGDEVRLRQVVTNLLSNAAKYTEKGSITLTMSGARNQDQFTLVVEVRDTGIGIKEENLDSLFSQFTRFDLEKNRNIEGTGLGLAITHQLVELMQGEIKVQSIYGVGTVFTVTVPQKIIDGTPMGDFHKRYRDVSLENAEYKEHFEAPNARILVVDDVEVNLKVIVNLLKATKIKVDVAHSGMQCLEMASQKMYDIIFLDHMMPEMDGVETYAKMRATENFINSSTPVIMLTANAISGVKEQYLQAGFADYLSKPVSGDKLEQMLMKYLPAGKVQADGAAPSGTAEAVEAEQKKTAVEEKKTLEPKEALKLLAAKYPGTDLELGLATCAGSEEVYIDIVKTFAEDSKAEQLTDCTDRKDAQNYQVLVHGVKSAAKSVGFVPLSEMALELENAAREADWAKIEEKHAAFIEEYQRALRAIGEVL